MNKKKDKPKKEQEKRNGAMRKARKRERTSIAKSGGRKEWKKVAVSIRKTSETAGK